MRALALLLAAALAPPAPFQESKPEPAKKEKDEKKREEEKRKKEEEERLFAVVGGDVYTIGAGTIRGGTVLCRGKKVWKVGLEVDVPKGTKVLDAKGFRVYPGLVAANSAGIFGGFAFGGGGGSPADAADPFSLSVQLASASGITAVFASNTVAKVIPGDLEGMMVRDSATASLSYTASNPTGRIETREKFEKAREYLRKFREWEEAKKTEPSAKEPPKQGVDDLILKLLRRELPARFQAGAADDLLAICDLVGEFGFDAVVDGAHEAWVVANELGRRGIRCVINPRVKVRPSKTTNRPTGSSIENAAALRRAGVDFAVVPPSVSVGTGGIAGRDLMTLPLDAAFAMRGGLDEQSALESVTLSAARVLGVADRLGSIEPGKDADLIVVSGDLLDYRTLVEFTIVNAKVVYDRQKSTFFSHIRPRRPIELVEEEPESQPASAPAEGERK